MTHFHFGGLPFLLLYRLPETVCDCVSYERFRGVLPDRHVGYRVVVDVGPVEVAPLEEPSRGCKVREFGPNRVDQEQLCCMLVRRLKDPILGTSLPCQCL